MQAFNHVAGGLVFTGIFASFHDVNVLSSPALIGATIVASLLPDIDHTRSGIGRTFYPVAKFLQSRYGHRTLTHSVFFYLAGIGLLGLAPRAYFVCGAYALGSHLLFDMCTRQGVPLLYPFSKRPFVLPANPSLRLSAQDYRSETVVFVIFLLLGWFCQPLFAAGFWTTYNRAFATWEHVQREAKRGRASARRDLLAVAWLDQQKRPRSGYFLRSEGSTLIVLTATGFELPKSSETSLIAFSHSGITATERQHTLTGVSLDSLNRLLTNHCLRVQVQSAEDLTYIDRHSDAGPLMKTGKLIDLAYCKNLLISQSFHDDSETINRIALLSIERQTARRQYAREVQLYRRALQKSQLLDLSLQQLASEYRAASDYRKGQIIMERKRLQTALEAARQSEPLPPLAPDLTRYDLQEQILRKSLEHDAPISANVIIISTSKPLR